MMSCASRPSADHALRASGLLKLSIAGLSALSITPNSPGTGEIWRG